MSGDVKDKEAKHKSLLFNKEQISFSLAHSKLCCSEITGERSTLSWDSFQKRILYAYVLYTYINEQQRKLSLHHTSK